MQYKNGGMIGLRSLLKDPNNAEMIVLLYHGLENGPVKIAMRHASVACLSSKKHEIEFRSYHSEFVLNGKIQIRSGNHLECLYNPLRAAQNMVHTEIDIRATQRELLVRLLKSKSENPQVVLTVGNI